MTILIVIASIVFYILIGLRIFRYQYLKSWQFYFTHKAEIESRNRKYCDSDWRNRNSLKIYESKRRWEIGWSVPAAIFWPIYYTGLIIIHDSKLIYGLLRPVLNLCFKAIWGDPKAAAKDKLIKQLSDEEKQKETEKYIREFDLV